MKYNDIEEYLDNKMYEFLLFTIDVFNLLNDDDYKEIDINKFRNYLEKVNNLKIVDDNMKKNAYIIIDKLKINDNNLLGECKRLINSATDNNLNDYLFNEYCKRTLIRNNILNKKIYKDVYSKEAIKLSIAFDYSNLSDLINDKITDEEFINNVLPGLISDNYLIYSINTLISEAPKLIGEKIKTRIILVLNANKESLKMMENDETFNNDIYRNVNKTYKKIKFKRI